MIVVLVLVRSAVECFAFLGIFRWWFLLSKLLTLHRIIGWCTTYTRHTPGFVGKVRLEVTTRDRLCGSLHKIHLLLGRPLLCVLWGKCFGVYPSEQGSILGSRTAVAHQASTMYRPPQLMGTYTGMVSIRRPSQAASIAAKRVKTKRGCVGEWMAHGRKRIWLPQTYKTWVHVHTADGGNILIYSVKYCSNGNINVNQLLRNISIELEWLCLGGVCPAPSYDSSDLTSVRPSRDLKE